MSDYTVRKKEVTVDGKAEALTVTVLNSAGRGIQLSITNRGCIIISALQKGWSDTGAVKKALTVADEWLTGIPTNEDPHET